MNKSQKFLIAVGFASLAVAQNPVVTPNGIVNVASFALAGQPNGAIAPGSMVVIFGSNMGPATLQVAGAYPLPTTLGGTSVKVTSGSTTTAAIMIYTSAGQIAAIIPSITPAGAATLVLTYNGKPSTPATFKIVPNSFGIFAANQGGSGPGIITNGSSQILGMTNAANPGDVAVIWGTGLGAVKGNEAGGPLPGDISSIPVEVSVGGQPAVVNYRGRSGCCAGVDQIAFTVPEVTGCRVPVTLKINDVVSNYTSMPVALAGSKTCTDAGGPSASEVQRFTTDGVSLGWVLLSRTTSFDTVTSGPLGTSDSGLVSLFKYSAAQVNASPNPFTAPALNATTVGACTAFPGGSVPGQPVSPLGLEAGGNISLAGAGSTKQIPRAIAGLYGAPLGSGTSLYFEPGIFTVSGSGGANVGAFQTTVTMPAALKWTNMDSIVNVNRAAGQLINWTGGDPAGNVTIFGYSATGTGASTISATFICTAKASDGQFTIPPATLLSLPVSGTNSGFFTGLLSVGTNTVPKLFTATGLDVGYAVGKVSVTKSVLNYQ